MCALSLDPRSPTRAAVEFARTTDGWDIALHHYAGARSDFPPVILCPGYACNRHFLDFDDRYSLARFLTRRGFDSWVLELRGHGLSEPADGGRSRAWTFDDLVEFDVPTAVAYVRAQCSGRRPVWVGHSMGGMLMYAALSQDAAVGESIAGLVTLAAPVAFPPVASQMMRSLGQLFLALPFPRQVPQRSILVALWWVISWSPGATVVGMNPANVDHHVFSDALRRAIHDVPQTMLRQLAEWSLSGEFRSSDGAVDYRANLPHITAPALIIAGSMDRLASPQMVRFAYDRISSTCKRYREFADYGHVDLLFGRRAPEEVFAAVSEWLENELVPATETRS